MTKLLPTRLHRLFRFGVAGMASTLAYFVLVNVLVLGAGMSAALASIVSYLNSLLLSYALQSRFAFRIKQDSGAQMTRFMFTSCCGLCVSYVIMMLTDNILQLPYIVGALAICVLIPAANYLVFRIWVFQPETDHRNRSDKSDEL